MSQAQYGSWVETMYLLSNPANAARIIEGIERHRRGEGVERKLIDPDTE